MIVGSCLCGRVRYQYAGEIDEISLCHCSQCRKAQGSAFVAVAPIARSLFTIVSGREQLKEFRATPGKARVFCGECGSPLYSVREDKPDVLRLRVGTLDSQIQASRLYNAFVGSKAGWYDIHGNYPEYDERPTDAGSP